MLNFEGLKSKYATAKKNLEQHPVPYLEYPPLPRSLSSSSVPYATSHNYHIDDYIGDPRYEYVCAYMKHADALEEVNKYSFWINFIRAVQTGVAIPCIDDFVFDLYHILGIVPPWLEDAVSTIVDLIRNSPLLI